MNKLRDFWQKQSIRSIASSFMAILFGLIICLIIMIITSLVNSNLPLSEAWKGFRILLGTLFYSGGEFGAFNAKNFGDMLCRATPLVMTGLSVAVAYKTGLFNIGAAGQYVCGTVATILVALSIDTTVVPAWIVWILAVLAGAVAGFIWGCIPGLFKALLNVNEVITCIMSNWIALHIAHWIFEMDYKKGVAGAKFVNLTEATKANFLYKTSSNGVSTPKFGLDKLFEGSQVDGGIIIAFVIAIIILIMLNRTTFGFELKATGKNRFAAKYAGMNDRRNIILSMGIAGALAAVGASLWYLNSFNEYGWTVNTSLPSAGFNGIPVAFLAFCNPIGTAFAACFMAYINLAGEQVKGAVAINAHISDLIVAVVVYLSAFSLMFREILAGNGLIAKAIKARKAKKDLALIESESLPASEPEGPIEPAADQAEEQKEE